MKLSFKFIIKNFLGPFILTFFIALFVLLMQFVWKYIEDMVGKGLGFGIIAELLLYTTSSMVPLALPLAVLLSSLMTFGNLGEHYELVAFRAAGISLKKIMLPLFYVILGLSVVAFLFSNYLLPVANLKMQALLYDIMKQKPAVNIIPGIFYDDIEGYTIKVGDKKAIANGDEIKDVIIYDHHKKNGNRNVLLADWGTMSSTPDKRYLEFTLHDGISYQEQQEKGRKKNYPLLRRKFEKTVIRIDMSQFEMNRTNEELFKTHRRMLNLRQLDFAVDSFISYNEKRAEALVSSIKNNISLYDTLDISLAGRKDSVLNPYAYMEPLVRRDKKRIINNALNVARGNKTRIFAINKEVSNRTIEIRKYMADWHKKLTLSVACILLFLIGAPLGAIIRKGGLGMPVVVSVIFFLVYHILSITGEKISEEGVWQVYQGMWLSTAILLPVGLFLTYKATSDATMFQLPPIFDIFSKLRKKQQAQ